MPLNFVCSPEANALSDRLQFDNFSKFKIFTDKKSQPNLYSEKAVAAKNMRVMNLGCASFGLE